MIQPLKELANPEFESLRQKINQLNMQIETGLVFWEL